MLTGTFAWGKGDPTQQAAGAALATKLHGAGSDQGNQAEAYGEQQAWNTDPANAGYQLGIIGDPSLRNPSGGSVTPNPVPAPAAAPAPASQQPLQQLALDTAPAPAEGYGAERQPELDRGLTNRMLPPSSVALAQLAAQMGRVY